MGLANHHDERRPARGKLLSSGGSQVGLVIDWSSKKIQAFDPATGEVKVFDNAASLPYAGRTAVLAISRRSVFVRAARVPNAAPEDVRTVVQIKLAELFPVPPSDLAFDFILLSDLNVDGRLALIVAMPVIELRKAHEQMAAAGIKISRTVPVALGTPLLAESLGYRDAAVVERLDELASVDIVTDGVLRYSRVVAPGAPIEVEVNRTYNAAGLPCSAVIAAGGTLVGEADHSTNATSLQALAQSSADKLKINLELPEVVAKRELRGRRNRQFFAFMLTVVAIGVAYTAWSNFSDAQAAVASAVSKANDNLKYQKKYETKTEGDHALQSQMLTTLNASFKPKQRIADIATVLSGLTPDGVWLTGLTIERGKEVTIRGTSKTNDQVSQYVRAVTGYSDAGGSHRFRNVVMAFATDSDIEKVPVVQFSLTAFPVGNFPITLQQKAGLMQVSN